MCDLPLRQEREDIFRVHMRKIKVAGAADEIVVRAAALTPGMRYVPFISVCSFMFSSGAQIASICNEAALYAARLGKTAVELSDFEYGVDRVVSGPCRIV
jgi:ATP-dependent Zn protease